MSSAVTIAISVISLAGTILTAAATGYFQLYAARDASLQQSRALHLKYRQPLLLASHELQSRLYNFCDQGFGRFIHGRRDYVIVHTIYLFAQYFAWLSILRLEIQFLDLDTSNESRRFWDLVEIIRRDFSSDSTNADFKLWSGDQQALGDLMIEHDKSNANQKCCMSYPDFRVKYEDDEKFSRWFKALEDDLERLAHGTTNDTRLRTIQGHFVDLVELLDSVGLMNRQGLRRCRTGTTQAI
ncbi:hypothetical protein M422DRAFT_69150 [Sphaerobolus stellatus SS14]|uniref:Uncharacterized protein n=1 Tax=Sphaerobolus stellatus (strain SS14) TaxID=990650 RepID=A0A0C9VKN7_SPHS4|nr:hypothetical protein M422DRAFT_69150 [Sphaerobolus stellatus SS14]